MYIKLTQIKRLLDLEQINEAPLHRSLNKLKFPKSIAQTPMVSLFETTVILDYSLNIYLSVQTAVQ
jgi:hypothetical protein